MLKAIYQCDDCNGRLFDLLMESGEIEIKCGKCKGLVKIGVDELSHLIEDYRKNQTYTPK